MWFVKFIYFKDLKFDTLDLIFYSSYLLQYLSYESQTFVLKISTMVIIFLNLCNNFDFFFLF